MELNRLARILKARWPAVILVAIAGFAAALAFTTLTSGRVEPVFEASVNIEFELEGEETVEDLADEIEGERRLAQFAAQDLLAEHQSSSIVADTGSARLVFYARSETDDLARERVQELVSAYIEAEPGGGADLEQQIAAYERQAEAIDEEIRALQPELSNAERELALEHQLLDLQIARITDEIVNLTVADAGATESEQADNAETLGDLRATLDGLQSRKVSLLPPPSTELSPSEQLRLAALERRKELLTVDYQRLALRTMGVTTRGNVQPATVNDFTPEPPSPLTNGMRGLLAGAGVALAGLFVMNRARREVWLASDLPIPLLGEVPRRKISNVLGPAWYDSVEGGSRKEAVQALRTAVEGVIDGPTSFTVVGDRVDSIDCHTLAVDLAVSFASAGRTVLVVDADYTATNELNEFSVGEPSLETVLRVPSRSEKSLAESASQILEEAVQIRPGLVVLPSGEPQASPADALAGHQFRVLLDQARVLFDLVVVVAGSARSATAQVMVQRTGSVLLAVSPGKTTMSSVDTLVSDFIVQRVRPIGTVMISGTDSRADNRSVFLPFRRREHEAPGRREKVESTVNRLRPYPTPLDKGHREAPSTPLQALAGGLAESRPGASEQDTLEQPAADDFVAELLALLGSSDPDASEPVAEYVVARVEDVLMAVSGQENLPAELVDVVIRDGLIPITSVRGFRTVGEWLVEELRWELGADAGERVASEFARLLSTDGSDVVDSLNAWLEKEFFPRHLERTQGEPEVWHLTSELGTLQVLAYGRRLDPARLTRLNSDVVRRKIDEFERRLHQAEEGDRTDDTELIEYQLRDLHMFEVALGMLQVGSSDEAKLVYPWLRDDQQPNGWVPLWKEGIRVNIAPLQRLGLLAIPVLTEEELISTRSSA